MEDSKTVFVRGDCAVYLRAIMVLQGRIELPTSSLPMTRSTTELLQPEPGREIAAIGQSRKLNLDGI